MSTSEETKQLNDTEKENEEEPKANEASKEKATEQNPAASLWTPVWDSNAQAYYYWNTETNETTWINPLEPANPTTTTQTPSAENPLDFLLDRIDNVVKKTLDDGQQVTSEEAQQQQQAYYDSSYYNDQYYGYTDYSTQAHFNSRTGRFTTQAEVERLNPEHLSMTARATRQMNAYFDVDSYTEQRNAERAAGGKVTKKKPLTRKEIEYFKRMKQEKKSKRAREWLLQ